MKIYLIGYKNCGKTTAGKILAQQLDFKFLDLDELIEQNDGRSVPEIFKQDGEGVFRTKEKAALIQTKDMEEVIVSTGGGAPRFKANMDFMKANGTVVYIRLSDEELVNRLEVVAKERPILKGKNRQELFDYVRFLKDNFEEEYLKAHTVVEADGLSPEDIAKQIMP